MRTVQLFTSALICAVLGALVLACPPGASAPDPLAGARALIICRHYQDAYESLLLIDPSGLPAETAVQREELKKYLEIMLYAQKNLVDSYHDRNVVFHYNKKKIGADEMHELARRYDLVYDKIVQSLAIAYTEPVHVFLYPESMELQLWHSLPELSLYNLALGETHVYYAGLGNHGQIEHEMVHIMSSQLGAFSDGTKLPALLIEGLAEYVVACPWGLHLDQWVRGFVELKSFIPLTALQSDDCFRQHNQIITYEEAGSFVCYLIQHYGLADFKRLYARPSFAAVYGKNLAELESEWLRKIDALTLQPDTLDLIAFRIRLGDLYKKPALLGSMPWIGIRTHIARDRVFIRNVLDNSPAENAGLHAGDEIIKVHDRAIDAHTLWRMQALLMEMRPGDMVTMAVRRDGRLITRDIALAAHPNTMVR